MAEPDTWIVPTYPDLAGKVAVVTGGSKGIGAATCRALAANRVRVGVVARDRVGIDGVVERLTREGGEAIGISADITSLAAVEGMRDLVEAELGPTDILIPLAGGFGRHTPILEITEEEFRNVVDWNLTSTFLAIKAFLPGMVERGRGAVVTMASNAARFLDIETTASYAAAKAGVVMLTRHVAREVGRHGVRLNCVAPATVMSERVGRLLDDHRIEQIAALAPLGRIGQPEDVALATLFLASESSSWITGVTLDVAGGRVII